MDAYIPKVHSILLNVTELSFLLVHCSTLNSLLLVI